MTYVTNDDGSYAVTVSNGQQATVRDPLGLVGHHQKDEKQVRQALERRALLTLGIDQGTADLQDSDF